MLNVVVNCVNSPAMFSQAGGASYLNSPSPLWGYFYIDGGSLSVKLTVIALQLISDPVPLSMQALDLLDLTNEVLFTQTVFSALPFRPHSQ